MQQNPQNPYMNMQQNPAWPQNGGTPPFAQQQPMQPGVPFGMQQPGVSFPQQQPVQPGAPFGMQQPMQPAPFAMQQPVQNGMPFNGFAMPGQPLQTGMPFPQQPQQDVQMMQQMQFAANQWQQNQMQQQSFPTQPIVNQRVREPKPPKQPKQPKPPKQPKQPKTPGSKKPAGLIIAIVLVVLALIGGGIFLVTSGVLGSAPQTAKISAATLGNTYSGDALIVRNEVAYNEEGVQNIDYVAQEGSLVTSRMLLCQVYSTGYSSNEMRVLQDYRDQIKDYQRTLLNTETAFDQRMEMLEDETIQRGLEVRSLVQGSHGNMVNQESTLKEAITQRQNYFRSKYASDMRLSRLYDDENTQKQRIESWIKPEFASQESIVSFYTDGFEQALSPTLFETYTPSQVRSMINGDKPATTAAERGRIDLYRLVKKDNYAVLLLVNDKNWNPTKDEVYDLELEQFTNTKVKAKVLSYARSGGELLVRLAVVDDVTNVLYMRTCEATIGESVACLSVPTSAIYTQGGAQGVVIIQDGTPRFVPVNILSQSGGKVYFNAIQSGILYDGVTVQLFD